MAAATTDREPPWKAGLRGARANLLPGLALQAVALVVVLAYYNHAPTRAAFEQLTVFRAHAGFVFGIVTTGVFGGFLPFLYLRTLHGSTCQFSWRHCALRQRMVCGSRQCAQALSEHPGMSPYEPEAEPNEGLSLPGQQRFFRMLEDLATSIPVSAEPSSSNPQARAREIVRAAGLRAGAMSATMALPPGPLGMLTVIPDLMKVWRIQQQMVADIAACFGKSAQLSRQMMVYCLFRHGAAMLVRDMVARVGERIIVKQAGLRVIQQTLRRIGLHVTERTIGRSLSRWLPIIGPFLIGGYSLLDTRTVGKTAIDTFSRRIEMEPDGSGDHGTATDPAT